MLVPTFRRRSLVAVVAFFALAGCTGVEPLPAAAPSPPVDDAASLQQDFHRLEQRFDSRLGVYAVDTGTGREVAYHADVRFAYASTHKALSVGAVLQRTAVGDLNKRITYDRGDLVRHSPVTSRHVDSGMTLRSVMGAAIRHSDNTAANLLFRELGGPAGLQAALRRIGDTTTRVDRVEPDLNETAPGDPRDTSTPRAMADSLRAFTLGNALPEDERAILTGMLRTNALTGDLIRAGVPAGWKVGDKSGAADYGTRNDIAVIWPPEGAPLVMAIMSERATEDADYDNALIAEAAGVAVRGLR